MITEIIMLIAVLATALGLAKHGRGRGRRRRMGKYMRGNIDESLSLGTLAAQAIVTDLWDNSVDSRTLLSSIVATYSINNITAPQGPLMFGVAMSDYTDAEIEAVIEEVGNSWNTGNLISQELNKRKIRRIGQIGSDQLAGTVDVFFNGGRPVKTKLNWVLQEGDGVTMWVYNVSAGALATTVPVLIAQGHANLWVL